MREFLRGLEFDDETIDCIMAEYGKLVTKDKEEITDLKSQILYLEEASKNAVDVQNKYDELVKQVEQENAAKKAEEENQMLMNTINEVIGNKTFVNDYTKNAIINDVKTALQDEANVGKSAKDLFTEITSGKTGLFVNDNQLIDMPEVNENVDGVLSKEAFDKMGYKERLELKQSNPALFQKYNV